MPIEFVSISFARIAFYFVAYIGLHVAVGLIQRKLQADSEFAPENGELKQRLKWAKMTFKWFPAIYVVFILLTL